MRIRIFLLGLAGAALACNTLLPPPATPSPAPTREPSATPAIQRPIPTETQSPPATANGVRVCDFVPGVSIPTQLPAAPEATPTPYPLPPLPANTAVDADTTARQLRVFQQLWDTVDSEHVYPDFRGRDWNAIGEKYRALITAGLTDDDFYTAMDVMIAELGDDHSYFESPEAVAEADAAFAGHNDYVGIGILWSGAPEADRGVIIVTFPDSPAQQAGLRSHDSILAVDGAPVFDESGALTQAIRGPEGTPVTITVQRPGGEPFDLTIVRHRITGALPIDYCLIASEHIGYIFLTGLDDQTIPDQVRAALEALTARGPLAGLILDNRENGGGESTVLEAILGLFTEGTVGQFVSRADERPLEITAEDVGGSQTVPLVVLVGEGTASYGEVLSGVLQDVGRARIVGETTSGNVETLWGYDFEDGSRAWIARETFQPVNQPNGIWEDTGIVPEVHVPTRWDLFTEMDDPALAAAVELLTSVPSP